jgi:hypothetical protein
MVKTPLIFVDNKLLVLLSLNDMLLYQVQVFVPRKGDQMTGLTSISSISVAISLVMIRLKAGEILPCFEPDYNVLPERTVC